MSGWFSNANGNDDENGRAYPAAVRRNAIRCFLRQQQLNPGASYDSAKRKLSSGRRFPSAARQRRKAQV